MKLLGDIMESGEEVVYRHPPAWLIAISVVLVCGWAVLLLVAEIVRALSGSAEPDWTIIAHALIVAGLLSVVFLFARWRVLITDRRVFVRKWWAVESISRDRIETAFSSGATLFIGGDDRVLSTYCSPYFAKLVLRFVDPIYDNIKLRTPGLRKRLVPGERVVLRERRSIPAILAWIAMPALPLLFFIAVLSYVHATGALPVKFSGIIGLVVLFLLLALFQFSIDISYFGVFFDHWRVAVTDRRVLVRRGLFGMRHDEIARDSLETARYDPEARRLFLSDGWRELAIRCNQAVADRILKALDFPGDGEVKSDGAI